MSNNFNIDQNTINKLNDMMKNGDVSKIMSNIPPEMLDNFSKMMNNSDTIIPFIISRIDLKMKKMPEKDSGFT